MFRRTRAALRALGGAESTYPTGKDWMATRTPPTSRNMRVGRAVAWPVLEGNWSSPWTGQKGSTRFGPHKPAGESQRMSLGQQRAHTFQRVGRPMESNPGFEPYNAGMLQANADKSQKVAALVDSAVRPSSDVYEPPQGAEVLLEQDVGGRLLLRVSHADITGAACDAVCIATDLTAAPADIVAEQVLTAAGADALSELQQGQETLGEIPVGCVGSVAAALPAGATRLVQCVVPQWRGGHFAEVDWLRGTAEAAFRECRFHQLRSIAMAQLGADWPPAAAATACVEAAMDWAECEARYGPTPAEISFVLWQREAAEAYAAVLQAACAA
eukprot:TRINITY_DN26575_c0_g1_i1.p1 TRINITY_DN26575_c0_g1~~TRINITY_DN26575_c0_g1_i1.p1  ORF type:complete len:357 (+),score=85.17 TRINITY_DN26575_c0_g1_i1:89-1072(+)